MPNCAFQVRLCANYNQQKVEWVEFSYENGFDKELTFIQILELNSWLFLQL